MINAEMMQSGPHAIAVAPTRRRATMALLVAIVALGARWPLLSQPGFLQDQVFFLQWASMAERGGIASIYQARNNGRPWCNYPPVYPYILRSLAGVYRIGTGQSLDADTIGDVIEGRMTPRTAAAIALFKMPAVIADAVTCALLVLWLSRRATLRTAATVSLLYALMPAVLFDSAIWGQVDSIPTLFVLIALECATRRRWTWVGVFAALAFLTKPQTLIFAPFFLIAAFFANVRRAQASLLLLAVGAVCVGAVVLIPLSPVREGVAKSYTGAAGLYPFVHLNGFSAWFLANPLPAPRLDAIGQYYLRDDRPVALWITPRQVGFTAMGFLVLAVLFRVVRLRGTGESIRQAVRILPLAFVVLSTQMHERYLVPAIACWAWAYQPARNWWIGWLTISAVAIVNLLWVWEQPLVTGAATSLTEWTRSSPGGIPTGVYCAIVLMVVLLMSLTGLDRRTSRRELNA